MGYLLTVIFLTAVCAFILFRVAAADRRAARALREAAEAEAKRSALEREALHRLEQMKNTDDLASAKRAIGRDPVRAARVVSNMMKGKEQ